MVTDCFLYECSTPTIHKWKNALNTRLLISFQENNVAFAGQNSSTLDVHLRAQDPAQTPSNSKNLSNRLVGKQIWQT